MKSSRALTVPVLSAKNASAKSTTFDHWLLGCIQQMVASAPLRFVLWDGWERSLHAGPPAGRPGSSGADEELCQLFQLS